MEYRNKTFSHAIYLYLIHFLHACTNPIHIPPSVDYQRPLDKFPSFSFFSIAISVLVEIVCEGVPVRHIFLLACTVKTSTDSCQVMDDKKWLHVFLHPPPHLPSHLLYFLLNYCSSPLCLILHLHLYFYFLRFFISVFSSLSSFKLFFSTLCMKRDC